MTARDARPEIAARRLFLLGGIALIVLGMLFGDIFAVFVLHQNAARVGSSLAAAAHAALDGNVAGVRSSFQNVGAFLENRGTKVDTHVHMIDFGYLALLVSLLEPRIRFRGAVKRRLAWLFLLGAGLLPTGVFLIHYVGLAYSPLSAIGWASIAADSGGLLVLVVTLICLVGLTRKGRSSEETTPACDPVFLSRDRSGQLLVAGGMALVLLGFAGGAYYAASDLYGHEARDYRDLLETARSAAARNAAALESALNDYGQLQAEKAVEIAAHAHAIEFGLLALLLALFQPLVNLRENAKRRCAQVLLLGSFLLPLCVLLELRFGLAAGALADLGGLLVILALVAMWVGILRSTKHPEAWNETGHASPGGLG